MRGFDRKLAFEENIFSLETIYPSLDGLNIGREEEGRGRVCKLLWRKCGHFPDRFPERHFPRTRISRPTYHFSYRAEDGLLLRGTSSSRSVGAIKE